MNGKHILIKLVLIMLSEALAMIATDLFSMYFVPIKHTTLSYIICGTLLAVIVVSLYDFHYHKRRNRIRQELRDLTDAALIRYHVNDEEDRHQD